MGWVFGGLFVGYVFSVTLESYACNSISLAHKKNIEAKQHKYSGQKNSVPSLALNNGTSMKALH